MIGILVFADFQLLDAAGPISVFENAARIARVRMPIKVVSATPGEVKSSSGVALLARGLKAASDAQTLLIAGGIGVDRAIKDKPTLSFVRAAARRGCAGSPASARAPMSSPRRDCLRAAGPRRIGVAPLTFVLATPM